MDALAYRILALAEALSEKHLFAYQKQFSFRIIEALLMHDGEMLTALWSRQSGKSETIGVTVAACGIILPVLANNPAFRDDWRLNCTDEQGNYRGYAKGLKVGIYAPVQEQADIAYTRVRDTMASATTQQVCDELGVSIVYNRGNKLWLSNGTKIRSQTASQNSNIEGESYHFLILDEAQDIGMTKVRKSLHPMVAAYNGIIVKIGTCGVEKSEFYLAIKANKRAFAQGMPQSHYEYNYLVCQEYNSMYKQFITKEKARLGEESDEFKLSYLCEWLLERGQFITDKQLMNPSVAMVAGGHHCAYEKLPQAWTCVAGVDIGKVHDPTVITVMHVDWNNPIADEWIPTPETEVHFVAYQKHIVGWKMIMGDNYEEQFTAITQYLSGFKGLRKIVVDATGVGQWGLDRFIVHYRDFHRGWAIDGTPDVGYVEVEGFVFNAQSKAEGYKLFHSDLITGRSTFPAGEKVRKTYEFRKFVGEMLDLRKSYVNGLLRCEAPDEPGAHDDFPDSAMLANWGAQTPSDLGEVQVEENNFLMAR